MSWKEELLWSMVPESWDADADLDVRDERFPLLGGRGRVASAGVGLFSDDDCCFHLSSVDMSSRHARDCWTDRSMWITAGRPGIRVDAQFVGRDFFLNLSVDVSRHKQSSRLIRSSVDNVVACRNSSA